MSPGPRNRDPIYCFRSPLEEEPVLPNRPAKCPWTKDLHKFEQSPHGEWAWKPSDGKILPSILKAVGNTPLVKLNKIPKAENIECEIYGKCEFMNPTGSIKERMVLRCIDDAEKCGTLKPGMTIIETTSGNTGIALAWICAVKGYKCIIVLSDKSSKEKEDIIKAFGATVERYPLGEDPLSENGKYGKSHYLHKQTPNSIILDQFSNPSNAVAHYDNTAEEIYYQCDGQVDMIITAAGSGGTTTGIGRKFKEISPNTIIIGADPYSSLFAEPPEINKTDVKFSEVEGIGDKIIPTICDRHNIDKWFKLYDNESLNMARRLIKEEGLLVGSSSGTMMAAALKAIKYFNLGKGKKVVVLFPDGTTNYLTKFIVDQWMEQRNLIDAKNTHNYWWWDINIMQLAFKPCQNVDHSTSPKEVLALMDKLKVDYLPVLKNGKKKRVIDGVATRTNILNRLIANNSPNDEVKNCLVRMFSKLPKESSLGLASRVLEIESYVVIMDKVEDVDIALGVVTSNDVFSFIENYQL